MKKNKAGTGFTVHNIVYFKPQEGEFATIFENLRNLSLQNAFINYYIQ